MYHPLFKKQMSKKEQLDKARLVKNSNSLKKTITSLEKVQSMNNGKKKKSAEASSYSSENSSREASPFIHSENTTIYFNNCVIQNGQNIQNAQHIQNSHNLKSKNTIEIFRDVFHNMGKNIYGRRWSLFTILFFATIYAISPKCFYFINNTIIIPSDTTIKKCINRNCEQIYNYDKIENINNTIEKFKESNNIINETIEGILAVDAVSTEPIVKILENGEVTGLITNMTLTEEEIIYLKNEIRRQEEFIKKVKNMTVSSAFVYQFQPLNSIYPCFVVFIEPAVNGKAGYNQIRNLNIIAESLKTKGFKVVAFATDGDSGYRGYHPLMNATVSEFQKLNGKTILESNNIKYTNDPLHILKRARYKLLTHNFTFLNLNDRTFNFRPLVDLLNLPGVVFDNSRITKMQDSLPLKLFTLENLHLLHNVGLLQHASYFLPFTILNAVLTCKNMLINDRVEMIEICIHYLNIFKKFVSSSNSKFKAPQKSNKTAVILFDNGLINDLLSTLITLNTIINTKTGIVSLNRIGTNPLEHHFGLLRLNSKFKHNYENFLKQQKKAEMLKAVEKELTVNIVRNRKRSYGVILALDERRFANQQTSKIAQALLQFYEVPLKTKIGKETMDLLVAIFLNKIEQYGTNEKIFKKECILNSKEIKLSPSMGAYIQKRQEYSEFKKETSDFSSDDYVDTRSINDFTINQPSSDSDDSSDDFYYGNYRKKEKTRNRKIQKSSSQPPTY